jgi:preprotein translocase subunit SecA
MNEQLYDTVYQTYLKKRNGIADRAYPLIKNVFETQKQYENIVIPFNDGKRQYAVISNLAKAYENKLEIPMAMEKSISLSVIDNAWKEHLREMDDLRQSVQNATYEQKDPLIIYKLESFGLFKTMIQDVNKNIATFLLCCDIPNIQTAGAPPVRQINRAQAKLERKDMLTQAHSDTQAHQHPNQPIKVEKTVGRNDPCPCGSGKKFKHCHGVN